RVAVEWKEDSAERHGGGALPRNNAEIVIVRLHQNVAATQMYLVRSQIASHDQESIGKRAAVGDLQARHDPLERSLARESARKQIAEGESVPAVAVAPEEAVVGPRRIIAHTGHTDEQIDIAHHFGEGERRNIGEGDRSGIAGAIEAHLVGGEVHINTPVRAVVAFEQVAAFRNSFNPEL